MKSYHYSLSVSSVVEKTHETPEELHLAYSYKSAIFFSLNKEEFPPLLSAYSPMESFTDTAKSSARARKSSDKSFFPISQPVMHNSVSSQKSNTRIEIPVKFDKTRTTLQISKIPSKGYLDNANRVLPKDVLKPRSIATCNLTYKAAKIPHVKLDIRKLSNNQSPTVSPNVIRSLLLNSHKQPSYANIRKPSRSVSILSHLKARNSAHQKLHHDHGADTKNVLANHLRYKSDHLWWKYQVKKI